MTTLKGLCCTIYGRHFFNISLERGRVSNSESLSFFLEFWFFSLEFWGFSLEFLEILTLQKVFCWFKKKQFPKCSLFWKYLVIKMVYLVVPLEILLKDEFFSWVFTNWSKVAPRGWVFSLSFLLEFCPWVLVFSAADVKKKAWSKYTRLVFTQFSKSFAVNNSGETWHSVLLSQGF